MQQHQMKHKWNREEDMFEDMVAENFSKLMADINHWLRKLRGQQAGYITELAKERKHFIACSKY